MSDLKNCAQENLNHSGGDGINQNVAIPNGAARFPCSGDDGSSKTLNVEDLSMTNSTVTSDSGKDNCLCEPPDIGAKSNLVENVLEGNAEEAPSACHDCGDQLDNKENSVDRMLSQLEAVTLKDQEQSDNVSEISYDVYESEKQMPDIMRLITKDLSEPYSIYTYRYFIHNWPKLCFLVRGFSKIIHSFF